MRRLALVVLLAGALLAGLSCMSAEHQYACYGSSDRLAHSPLCPRVLSYRDGLSTDLSRDRWMIGFDSYRQAAAAGYINCCPFCQQMRAPNDN